MRFADGLVDIYHLRYNGKRLQGESISAYIPGEMIHIRTKPHLFIIGRIM
jgi:hypothetical protein